MKTTLAAMVLSVVCVLAGLSQARAAIIYDAALDFSATNNPNGAWSYGWSVTTGGPFILALDNTPTAGLERWRGNLSADGNPSALFNPTASDIALGNTIWLPGRFTMHPGPTGENADLRWVAPSAGSITLDAAFQGRTTSSTTTDVHILLNGTSLLSGSVNGFGPGSGPSHSSTFLVFAGDTLDFAVGFGSGGFFGDTTQVDARIEFTANAAVPEPATLTMFGLGALGLAGAGLFRRRAKEWFPVRGN